jgi:HK97 family phage major capsid protein
MTEPTLEAKLAAIDTALQKFLAKRDEEIVTLGKASEETKKSLEALGKQWSENAARLLQVEQAIVARNPGAGNFEQPKSLGALMTASDGFKAMQGGASRTGKITVGSFHTKANIINAPGPLQPLVPDVRLPGILMPGLRRLTIRDLMPNNRTSSNLIQYTREDVFTNAAAPVAESIDKPQSMLTFSLHNAPVQTIAHWIAASRQIIDDAPALEDYINTRLLFGLKLVEEDQFLKGDGTGQNISGLLINATAMTRALPSSPTDIDAIRVAKTQVTDSFFEPDAVVLHPHDWERIELTKTTIGNYVVSVPQEGAPPRLWGLDVVPTPAIPVGTYLVGAFRMAAAVWDRQDASIEVSREHASFFTQNMVAILCEERVALTVFRPTALVTGTLPQTGS